MGDGVPYPLCEVAGNRFARTSGLQNTLCLTCVNSRSTVRGDFGVARSGHPNKHIEGAVRNAEQCGWRFEAGAGHCWGRLFCDGKARGACIIVVYSTPRVPENHAKRIRRQVEQCPHAAEKE
jgi:hypothetical protein